MQSKSDYYLLIKSTVTHKIVLLIYVDDIFLSDNDIQEIVLVKKLLDDKFRIKNLGPLKFFLVLEVERSSAGIVLSQRKYALELLEDVGLLACKPTSTPMVPGLKLRQDDGEPLPYPTSYRRLLDQHTSKYMF